MTSHKRKASEELSRTAITLESTNVGHPVMGTTSWWSWCTGVYKTLLAPFTSSSNISSPDQDSQIHTFEQREDGTTIKRQRVRRTKSATMIPTEKKERHQAGRGRLDVGRCATEDEATKCIDDFFAPPDPFSSRRFIRIPESSKPLEPSETSSDDEEDEPNIPYGRFSESTAYLSPAPSPTTPKPATPQSDTPHTTTSQTSIPGDEDSSELTRKLEGLLVTPEETSDPRFHLSTSARARFVKQANERKVFERAEAIRAARERRLVRRYPAKRLVDNLSNHWEELVSDAYYERNPNRVLAKAIKGTELHHHDFNSLLRPKNWLNDEIINAYLEWVEDAANEAANAEDFMFGERPSDVPKFIAHNSFFYKNIQDKGPNSQDRLMRRKKAPGKSFLEVDSMFVPICQGAHWTIAVIRPIAKTIEYFDSMGGRGHQVINHLRSWLKCQLGSAYVEEEWTVPRTQCAVQNNGYDCGVFVCTNSLCVALGIDTFSYTESEMTQQRRNIAAVLLNRGFVGDFTWNKIGM